VNTLLVTGASSFSATNFLELFATQWHSDFELIGTSRSQSSASNWSDYHRGDVVDEGFAKRLIETTNPTHVIHLAGNSNPGEAAEMFRVNLQGTWNLLLACTRLAIPPRVLLVGSAAGFGEMRYDESTLSGIRPANPNSLYGLVREQALEIGSFFRRNYQIPVVCCRTFNLIGPGLPDKYAPTAIIKRVLMAERQSWENFEIANGNHVRDFLDIRDACRAWKSILLHGSTERIYSVGSGRATTIRELMETILNCLGIEATISEAAQLGHPNRSQITRSVADICDLETDFHWAPDKTLRESVMDMISYLKHTVNHSTDSN
jgi:GDP-4-dehydro-6-deoxy-D-mannose reductase